MAPEVSIIIPVYKVEKYIRRCMDSVLQQTIKDIEVILIDDGSPDNCGKICDEYALNDSRVKVIHQANAGASEARNSGLDIAAGDYIGFTDPDDCIAPNMFEQLLRHVEKYDADIAICEYTEIDGEQVLPLCECNENRIRVLDLNEAFRLITDIDKRINVTIWNKLYRHELIGDLRFDPNRRVCHDAEFLMKALSESKKAVYLPTVLYGYYVQRPGALTSHADHDQDLGWNIESYHHDISQTMDDFSKAHPELKDAADAYKCAGNMFVAKAMVRAGKIDRNTARFVRSEMMKHLFPIIKSGLPADFKLQMALFLISPRLYQAVYKTMKKL